LACPRAGRLALPFSRQALWLGMQQPEKLLHDTARFRGHAVDAVVTIHALEKKTAQAALLLPHAGRKCDHSRRMAADIGCALRLQRGDTAVRFSDDVADH